MAVPRPPGVLMHHAKTTRLYSLPASLVAGFLLSTAAHAEALAFQVAFADVPGTTHLAAGRLEQGIEILERRRANPEIEPLFDERSTLCAAYILAGRLNNAARACHDAVANDNSVAAFNNRGVYRAHAGDIDGALSDFSRIRLASGDRNDFVDELPPANARVMATGNFQLAERLRGMGRRQVLGQQRARQGVRGASIEDIEG